MAVRLSDFAASRTRALRRLATLRSTRLLGGVSLALLAPAALAQTAPADAARADAIRARISPADAARIREALTAMTPARRAAVLARYGYRETPDGQFVPAGAASRIRPANAAAQRALGGGPFFGTSETNPFGITPLQTAAASDNAAPAAVDLDDDGDLDVLAGSGGGTFNFYQNTGTGTAPAFATPALDPFGLSGDAQGETTPTTGDLDADGDLDLLVGNKLGTLVYYENTAGQDATPTYAAGQSGAFGLTTPGPIAAPHLVDLDGDGDLDVLVGDKSGVLSYFQNTGDAGAPAFAAPVTGAFGLSPDVGNNARPTVGDLNGDGDLDVLVGDKSGSLLYFENTAATGATPAFGPAQANPFGLTAFPTGGNPEAFTSPDILDIDGDDDADILVGLADGSFSLFTNTAGEAATPAFGAPTATPYGLTPVQALTNVGLASVAQADLDGDGDTDALIGEADGSFGFFENTAGPQTEPAFAARQTNPFGLVGLTVNSAPAIGDLDGDGDLDVLAVQTNSSIPIQFFQNTAGPGVDPAFALPLPAPFGLPDAATDTLGVPAIADLDGDGDADLLAGRADGNFGYFENTAGPQAIPAFAPRQTNPFGLSQVGQQSGPPPDLSQRGGPSGQSAPTVADLDGDGDLDVLAGDAYGVLTLFLNTAGPRATPAFSRLAPGSLGLNATVSGGYSRPSLADLDGDGDTDVLTGDGAGNVTFQRNEGATATLTARLDGTTGYRMLAAPAGTPLGTLLGPEIYTQGFPDADQANGQSTVYIYDEAVPGNKDLGFFAPVSLGAPLGAGVGAFVYVFEDEDPRPTAPGTEGGFPKTLTATPTSRPATVEFNWGTASDAPLSYTDSPNPAADDGWNLLGNPFGSWFDWDATDLTNVNAPVYVYDNATANYLVHSRGIPNAGSLPGGIVGPFQGFWAQTNAAAPAITARPGVSNGGPLYRDADAPAVVGLRLRPGTASALPAGVQSEAFVALGIAGTDAGLDGLDALALVPPAQAYVLLAAQGRAIDARPDASGVTTVALDVTAVANGSALGTDLVLDWPALDLPAGWRAELRDAQTGARVDMATATEYAFTLAGPSLAEAPDALAVPALGAAPVAAEALTAGRFALVVTPAGVTAGGETVRELALSAARPNPTTGAASLVLSLPAASAVEVGVFDVLGRRVAVLAEGTLGAGDHALRVAPGALAAGTYVVRATVGAQVLTQRLTVTR